MKLETAIATAKQQLDPAYEGRRWPENMGFYKASNGQWMTGARHDHANWYRPDEFLSLWERKGDKQ